MSVTKAGHRMNGLGTYTEEDDLFPMADQDRETLLGIASAQKANAETLRALRVELVEIKANVAKLTDTFVPRREVDLLNTMGQQERQRLKERIAELEDADKKKRWAFYGAVVAAIISALAAIVQTGLLR